MLQLFCLLATGRCHSENPGAFRALNGPALAASRKAVGYLRRTVLRKRARKEAFACAVSACHSPDVLETSLFARHCRSQHVEKRKFDYAARRDW